MCAGVTTATTGLAVVTASSLRYASLELRIQMPFTTISASATATTSPASASPRRRTLGGGDWLSRDMSDSGAVPGRGGLLAMAAVDEAKHDGNENERRDRRKNQATDHGPPERRVLLAAFAQAERHRRHADDHGERGHQDRAEAHDAGVERGSCRITQLGQ